MVANRILDYLWIIPVIGTLLWLTSLTSPAANFSYSGFGFSITGYFYYWGYGLFEGSVIGFGSFSESFFPTDPIQQFGIIGMVFVLVFVGLINMRISFQVKSGDIDNESAAIPWLIMGAMVLVMGIIWIVMVEIMASQQVSQLTLGLFNISFWEMSTPSYGIIGLIIGGILTLATGVIGMILKQFR